MGDGGHATLRLKVLGESRSVSVAVPGTPARAGDILEAARAITNATMEVAFEKAAAAGRPASCGRGCSACCHQLVGITAPEARMLSRLVEAMPAERREMVKGRFAATLAVVRAAGILEEGNADGDPVVVIREEGSPYVAMARRYFALQRACPFLESGECSIYEQRPLICREYAVTSPAENCGRFDLEAIEMVEPPVRLSDGLGEVTAVVEGKGAVEIPMFAALAWAGMEGNGEPERNVSGVELLKLLARWVDRRAGGRSNDE